MDVQYSEELDYVLACVWVLCDSHMSPVEWLSSRRSILSLISPYPITVHGAPCLSTLWFLESIDPLLFPNTQSIVGINQHFIPTAYRPKAYINNFNKKLLTRFREIMS